MLFFLLFLLIIASPAFADEAAQLPEITVWGVPTISSGDSTTSIPAREYRSRSVNLPDVLAREAGVHVTRYGGSEEAASISIRGSDPGEVEFYLDGIPLSTATGQSVDLSVFELEDLESIDVHRGSGPATLGSAPAVGLVNLKSTRIKKGAAGLAAIQYGSFNSFKETGRFSYGGKGWGVLFSQAIWRTAGNFSFLDDNGTPVNPTDDTRTARQNNASLTVHPYGRVYYDFDAGKRLELTTHAVFKHNGVPGLSSNQSVTADLSQTDFLLGLRWSQDRFFSDKITFAEQTYLRLAKSQYSDPLGEIGLGGAQDTDNDQKVVGNRAEIVWNPSPRHELSGAVTAQYEDFKPEDFLAVPSTGKVSSRQTINLTVEHKMNFWGNRLEINPALGLNNVFNHLSDADPSFLTPSTLSDNSTRHPVTARLGVVGKISQALSLAAHGGRSVRLPNFSELFGDRGGVVGNPFLNNQKEWSWDVETVFAKRFPLWINEISVRGTFFDRHVTDLIQFEQNVGFARAENVGSAHVWGSEWSVGATFWKRVEARLGYTFQRAKDEATNKGRFLAGRPQHELHSHLSYSHRWGNVYTNFDWTDRYFLDPLNTRVVTDRVIWGAGVEATFKKNWVASLEARNLTNSQIVDAVGFPLPGRSYWGKIIYKW